MLNFVETFIIKNTYVLDNCYSLPKSGREKRREKRRLEKGKK
jgi:hypothetical protein